MGRVESGLRLILLAAGAGFAVLLAMTLAAVTLSRVAPWYLWGGTLAAALMTGGAGAWKCSTYSVARAYARGSAVCLFLATCSALLVLYDSYSSTGVVALVSLPLLLSIAMTSFHHFLMELADDLEDETLAYYGRRGRTSGFFFLGSCFAFLPLEILAEASGFLVMLLGLLACVLYFAVGVVRARRLVAAKA